MKKLRRVSEAEVISEFLKAEFYREEFHADRQQNEPLIFHPNLTDEKENEVRRGLLLRTHFHHWQELPTDTAWWEVRVEGSDLENIRIWPRGRWRKISQEKFPKLMDVVQGIRSNRFHESTGKDVAKILALSYRLRAGDESSAVMLIGVDEQNPMIILEGNHRLTAALLASEEVLQKSFRVYCGFSAHMRDYWIYETTPATYFRHVYRKLRRMAEAKIGIRDLQASAR